MTHNLDDIINALPPEQQAHIESRYQTLKTEYLTLQELRKQLAITQQDMANTLGIHQVNVSKLEKRADLKLSTLQQYANALGGTLHLSITINGKTAELIGFGNPLTT
jgi:DNA-binding XRE family transcriptional regulator